MLPARRLQLAWLAFSGSWTCQRQVACVAFALVHESMQQIEPDPGETESTLAGKVLFTASKLLLPPPKEVAEAPPGSPGGASGLGLDGIGTDNATHQRGASVSWQANSFAASLQIRSMPVFSERHDLPQT